MRLSICARRFIAMAWAATLWIPASMMGQERIDRRNQARNAFLSTPEGVYSHYCGHCHGEQGRGSGRLWASELSPSPPDLTALGQDKAYIVEVIREGSVVHGRSNLCPPWGNTLSPEIVERLAQYVVSLGQGPTSDLKAAAGPSRASESFPWLLLVLLLGEFLLLWRLLRRKSVA